MDLEGVEPDRGLRGRDAVLTSGQRRSEEEEEDEENAASHPSGGRLQDAGQDVVLELEELRWLTVHLEAVGVVVEFHRAHKVAVAGHDVGELGADRPVRTQSQPGENAEKVEPFLPKFQTRWWRRIRQ